jgi:hypothetical protein
MFCSLLTASWCLPFPRQLAAGSRLIRQKPGSKLQRERDVADATRQRHFKDVQIICAGLMVNPLRPGPQWIEKLRQRQSAEESSLRREPWLNEQNKPCTER